MVFKYVGGLSCRREETGILEVDREECCDQAADILSEMRGESFRYVFYVREVFSADDISCFYPGLIMVGGVLRQALVSERKPYYVQSKNCWTLYFKLSAEIYKKN